MKSKMRNENRKTMKANEAKAVGAFGGSNSLNSSVKMKMKLTLSIVGCLLLCCGCGKKQSESHTLPLPPALEQRVQEKAKLDSVVAGNTAFAVDLYHQLRTAPGNLFFSPYSLSSALAMTYAGARGIFRLGRGLPRKKPEPPSPQAKAY